jgi:hypothetical protein
VTVLEKFNELFMKYLRHLEQKYANVLYQSYSIFCNEKDNHDRALEHLYRLETHIDQCIKKPCSTKDHKLLNSYNELVGYVESQLNCYEELAGKNQELRAKFDEIRLKGEIAIKDLENAINNNNSSAIHDYSEKVFSTVGNLSPGILNPPENRFYAEDVHTIHDMIRYLDHKSMDVLREL